MEARRHLQGIGVSESVFAKIESLLLSVQTSLAILLPSQHVADTHQKSRKNGFCVGACSPLGATVQLEGPANGWKATFLEISICFQMSDIYTFSEKL